MSLFNRLFGKRSEPEGTQRVTCPRCLGKGFVDDEDIRRLDRIRYWSPGNCAYCRATGKVFPRLIESVPADEAYLTVDLEKDERERLLLNDLRARHRAKAFKEMTDAFVAEILELHDREFLSTPEIVDIMLSRYPEMVGEGVSAKEVRKDLLGYVDRVTGAA